MVINKFKKALMQIFIITCIAIIIISFAGCGYKGYSGKDVDLYTVAVNSILWNNGFSYQTEKVTDSHIKIIEEDEFGRTIFTYYEKYYSGAEISFSALIISQCSFDGYVYYYEDKNYLIKQQELYVAEIQDFTNEEIDRLKSVNDWGKAVDLQKCTKKKIDKKKQEIPINENVIEEKAIDKFNLSEMRHNVYMDYLTGDANGNFIIYGSIFSYNAEDNLSIYYAAFINSDYEIIDWLVPSDLYNYQNDLINFKNKNGWSNQPQ